MKVSLCSGRRNAAGFRHDDRRLRHMQTDLIAVITTSHDCPFFKAEAEGCFEAESQETWL